MRGIILKWGNNGQYKELNNQKITTFTCVLLSAATTFDAEYKSTVRNVFILARTLQMFAPAMFLWLALETDVEAHVEMFAVEGPLKYFTDVHAMAEQYLAAFEKVKMEDEETCAVLDKPNNHRAIELDMPQYQPLLYPATARRWS